MEGLVRLQADDIVAERYFAHPKHIFYDQRVLRYMLRRLRGVLEADQLLAGQTVSLHLEQLESDGRWHRIIVNQPQLLQQSSELFVVGFCGQRRYDADPTQVDELDQTLLREIPHHPGLLSYSTMELTHGDMVNCVIFHDEAAKMQWSTSETHHRAAGNISPHYYFSIRLYNGHISGGLSASERLKLTSVKYYDYRDGALWRAIRVMGSEEARK